MQHVGVISHQDGGSGIHDGFPVGGVESLFEQLISQSAILTKARLATLEEIEVVRRGGGERGGKSKMPKISKLGTRTWLVGRHELEEISPKEQKYTEKIQAELAEEHGGELGDYMWLKWPGEGKFALECLPGDRIFSIWRNSIQDKIPTGVHNATPILRRERKNGVTFLFLHQQDDSGLKGWKQFKVAMERLGQRTPVAASVRVLDADTAECLMRLWKNAK